MDYVNRNYYAGLMSNNNSDWIKNLSHVFRTLAKAAKGFYDALR